MEEDGPADVGRKNCGQNLDDHELGYLQWRVSDHEGFAIYSGMENHVMVRNRSAWSMKMDPANVTRWKHKFGFHNKGVQWDTPMLKSAGEGKDWIQLMARGPPCKEDVTISLLKKTRQPTETKPQKG